MRPGELIVAYRLEDNILFELADKNNPQYSLEEYDLYLNHDHRLSLRKNLATGEWEFYKHNFRIQEDTVVWKSTDWPKTLTHLNKLLQDWHKLQRKREEQAHAESELKSIFGMK
jgi:hypothetical protein